jgi:hypothetical protein
VAEREIVAAQAIALNQLDRSLVELLPGGLLRNNSPKLSHSKMLP